MAKKAASKGRLSPPQITEDPTARPPSIQQPKALETLACLTSPLATSLFKRVEHIGKGRLAEVYCGIDIVRHGRSSEDETEMLTAC